MRISENGVYKITPTISLANAASVAVYTSGDAGGGTLQLQVAGIDGGFSDMTDGLLTEVSQTKVDKGTGVILYLYVSGATSPYFEVTVARLG